MKDSNINVPQSRVNITLDVEHEGQMQKKELPLKLLLIGDFSNGKSKESLASRKKYPLKRTSFNKVLAALSPEVDLNISIDDACCQQFNIEADQKVHLTFRSLTDFHPHNIVKQVPTLKYLVGMRNLLKELRANMIGNKLFQEGVDDLLGNKGGSKALLEAFELDCSKDEKKEKKEGEEDA